MKNTITSAAEVMLAAESELQGHTCDVDPERLREYATALHDAGMLRPPPHPLRATNSRRRARLVEPVFRHRNNHAEERPEMTDQTIKNKIIVTEYADGNHTIEAPDGINVPDLPDIAAAILLAALASPGWPEAISKERILGAILDRLLAVVGDNTDLDVESIIRSILVAAENAGGGNA